jgi:uncharacterized protein
MLRWVERKNGMLIAHARVETERPGRYLAQLCRHVEEVAQARPHMPARVEWSQEQGVIDFGSGRCTVHAAAGVLTLRIEAPDEETLRLVQHRITDRLERFGRRERLAVPWTVQHDGNEG